MVFPTKYRLVVFDKSVDEFLKEVCLELEDRYQVKFLEVRANEDHVHFLVQSIPRYSVTKMVRLIKSITVRDLFRRCPDVKSNYRAESFGQMVIFAVR